MPTLLAPLQAWKHNEEIQSRHLYRTFVKKSIGKLQIYGALNVFIRKKITAITIVVFYFLLSILLTFLGTLKSEYIKAA